MADGQAGSDERYSGVENLEALEAARRYNRFLVQQVVRSAAGSPSAVDFGAGTGTLARAVRERGLDVRCVEPDPGLRARLDAAGLPAVASIEELAGGTVPYIYSANVLEHIEDDREALRQLFGRLRPGGRLFLYVPAFQLLYSEMDRRVGHHRRYRRGGLCRLARSVGFELLEASYVDSLGFGAALLYRLLHRGDGELDPRTVGIYDRFVFPPSRALDRLGAGRLFGKNLMITLSRP